MTSSWWNDGPRSGGRGVRRSILLLPVICVLAAGCGSLSLPEAEEPTLSTEDLPFRLPKGYVAMKVAGPPLISHPMFACFDDRGRLYVAGSSGHNLEPSALRHDPPDVIRCLEDRDGDGHFDKSTIFADRLTYPEGVLWHDGAIYTASPPSLWRLEDTNSDGVADQRQELVTGFPFTGIADDLHGPNLGPDGRLYWGVGRFDYAIRKPGGSVLRRGKTPLIMRCLPDGAEVEVFSAAMGNPVEVAFSAEGEAFASGTFLSPEAQGEGLRDAIIHCVYGGLYSVRDRDLSGEIRTGDLLPPLAQLKVAAASGILRARGGGFGDDQRTVLYSALFNLHSVTRHVLERDGATFRSREEPFLESDVADFHPTDVLEDADGSLLVIDTGGWFKHCPTSQVEKPNVSGGIYRIRRRDAARPTDPWGQKIRWDQRSPRDLVQLLYDPRFAVRDRASSLLVQLGDEAVPAIRRSFGRGRSRVGIKAVWTLARINTDDARAAIRDALRDRDPGVRIAAAAACGLSRDPRAYQRLVELVKSDTAAVRREAAAALSRLDRPEAVPALIQALRAHPDRFLEHALILGLVKLANRRETLAALNDPSPVVRRGALMALEQMPRGAPTLELVRPFLEAPEPELRQTALWVVARHHEWAGPMAVTFRRWLSQSDPGKRSDDLRPQLLAFSQDTDTQAVIAEALEQRKAPAAIRIRLLEVMATASLGTWPPSWTEALRQALADPDPQVVRQAVAVIGTTGRKEFDETLLALARDASRGDDTRVEALEVVAPRQQHLDPVLFTFLVERLRVGEPPLRRMCAARALGAAAVDDGQLLTLCTSVAQAGSLVLPRLIAAYAHSSNPRVGAALIAALDSSPGLRSLTDEDLERILRVYPAEIQQQARGLLARLQIDEREKAARLAELTPILGMGDAKRGHDVFFSPRATCSTCHTIRTAGGRVGPDLSRIGAARGGRDLLEAILFPSASFARGYEPVTIATNDGRVHTGIVNRQASDAVILTTPDRAEIRLGRDSIEEIEPGRTSIMPRGLDANLNRQELADLVAFLQSLK